MRLYPKPNGKTILR